MRDRVRQPRHRLGAADGAVRRGRRRDRRTRAAAAARTSTPHARSASPGTVTSLAALDLGLAEYDRERVHGHVLTRTPSRSSCERLAALPLDERRRLPALDPERAPVIVAGATIVREVLRRYGARRARASERDLLHGVALAAAELPEPVEGDAPLPAPTPAARRRSSTGGSSSARRRCTTARERMPTRRPSSVTGTRSRSRSSSSRNASRDPDRRRA